MIESDSEKKDEASLKHIEHLRQLAKSQIGKTPILSDKKLWLEKNAAWRSSDKFKKIIQENNKRKRIYSQKDILIHAKDIEVEILSDMSVLGRIIQIRWPSGDKRGVAINKFMKMNEQPKNKKIEDAQKRLRSIGISIVSIDVYCKRATVAYKGISWKQYWCGSPNKYSFKIIDLIDRLDLMGDKSQSKFDELVTSRSKAVAADKKRQTNLKKYGAEEYFRSDVFLNAMDSNERFTSRAELEIKDFLKTHNIQTSKKRLNNIEYDLVSEEHRLAIEYNGLYWHSEIKDRGNKCHLNKTLNAEKHGYRLLHIFEHEWADRKEQVKTYLLSIFKKNKPIYARRCELISGENNKEVADFVDKYHIQGVTNFTLFVGLKYNNELTAVATFGRHHRDSSKTVLNRFVCLPGITVVGGLSRITKFASNLLKTDIISWCDLRLSQGNGYLKSGWTQEEVLKPDYFYIDLKHTCKVISKQSRQKMIVNTPNGMTEREHSLLDGLSRVWDCGKIRFVYRYKNVS